MRHIFRASSAALTLVGTLLTAASRVDAQATTSLLPDANVLPSRAFSFGVRTSFTRFDELLGTGNGRNLAFSLNTDSLGVKELPALAAAQTDIQALGLAGFRLSAGQLSAVANSRIVTAPIVIEYGVSSRLKLGVVVPLVETRTTLIAQLNRTPGFANVGLNPAIGDNGSAALNQNNAFVTSLRAAADTLQRRVTLCQTTPANPICTSINGQTSATQALIAATTAYAAAIERLFGTNATHPGDAFVPLSSSTAATAITTQLVALANQYKTFLNSTPIIGSFAPALGPAARDQLQALLAAYGHDSIQVADRSSIGDISVGATYQLANTFTDTTNQGGAYRVALNGTFRIGTGEPANRNRFFDNNTGYGQHGVIGGLAADVRFNHHWAFSANGSYTAQLGTVEVNRLPNTGNAAFPLGFALGGTYSAGNVMQLTVMPRYTLAGSLSFNGIYSIVNTAADTYTGSPLVDPQPGSTPVAPYGLASGTAQQIGIGFSYSTIAAGDRGPGRLPFEISYSHLETITGSGGPVAKTFRDQLELKIYWLRR